MVLGLLPSSRGASSRGARSQTSGVSADHSGDLTAHNLIETNRRV